jgi:hypothetical protein
MMKVLSILILSCTFLSTSLLIAQQQQPRPCNCKNCQCTPKSHCGCFSNQGCNCSENSSCGANSAKPGQQLSLNDPVQAK